MIEERGREGGRSGSSYRLTIASGRAYIYRVTQNRWETVDSLRMSSVCLSISVCLSLSLLPFFPPSQLCLSFPCLCLRLSIRFFLIPKSGFVSKRVLLPFP